jgi:ABC-type sugar transport system permease subunit
MKRVDVVAITPLLAFLVLFLVYPMLHAIGMAFTDGTAGQFPSLENFRSLWRDRLFWSAVLGNIVLPVCSVVVELLLGLALALLLTQQFRGRRALRAIVILPFAIPEIVFLTIMRYAFAPRGYVNAALLGVGGAPIDWLRPGSALAYATVVAADAWHVTPVVFLLLLAALTAIPEDIGEAAKLDGAGGWARFRHITLPLLQPAIVAAVLLRGLDALRMFSTPLVLTGVEGVPVLSSYAYHQWSDYGDDGAAAAAAVLLALLSLFLSAPLLRRRVGAWESVR